jgi:tetratricopeptide (TPR) repeat protein
MHVIQIVRLAVTVTILLCFSMAARTQQANHDDADLDRAAAMYNKGDAAGALAVVESVLAHAPENENALYRSALFNFQLNNVEAARGRLERLAKISGNYFAAWELMVQVTQAQGDLARRDDAIERMKIAIRTALDPAIRHKADFIRDRIRIGDKTLSAADYFERGGSDFTRYQFSFGDPRMAPDTGLLLRTDALTTENWADTALMPQDKQLFHLDMVDTKPGGDERTAVYEYYVGEPSYDAVRAKVMRILRGEAMPLAGEPGSLQGIMKK